MSWRCQQFVIFRRTALRRRARGLQSHFGVLFAPGAAVIALNVELSFSLAGAGCVLRTNCLSFAESIERSTEKSQGSAVCELNVEVDAGDHPPRGPAHFRGMHHVIVASFGAANVFVFDLRRRIVTAKVS